MGAMVSPTTETQLDTDRRESALLHALGLDAERLVVSKISPFPAGKRAAHEPLTPAELEAFSPDDGCSSNPSQKALAAAQREQELVLFRDVRNLAALPNKADDLWIAIPGHKPACYNLSLIYEGAVDLDSSSFRTAIEPGIKAHVSALCESVTHSGARHQPDTSKIQKLLALPEESASESQKWLAKLSGHLETNGYQAHEIAAVMFALDAPASPLIHCLKVHSYKDEPADILSGHPGEFHLGCNSTGPFIRFFPPTSAGQKPLAISLRDIFERRGILRGSDPLSMQQVITLASWISAERHGGDVTKPVCQALGLTGNRLADLLTVTFLNAGEPHDCQKLLSEWRAPSRRTAFNTPHPAMFPRPSEQGFSPEQLHTTAGNILAALRAGPQLPGSDLGELRHPKRAI